MCLLAALIVIPYGLIGSYRGTEQLRRNRLPVADCGAMAMLGVALMLGGLGLLLGAPASVPVVGLLVAWRGLAVYNASLLRGRPRRQDFWPGAWREVALSVLIVAGG